ncbi:hypothetical protein F4776DRAFT_662601 [Hypoxylon sp. NC0597]|nr:hypothetical protein F4776DRAFT_662601 [Hypoxylon sp. NC0597]
MSSPLDGLYLLSPEEQDAILEGPALAPPDGVNPNFETPPNRDAEARAIALVCLVLVSLTLLLRAYAKLFCLKRVHVEDCLAFLAYGLYIGYIYCVFRCSEQSFFVHQWNIRVAKLDELLYVVQLAFNFYVIGILFLKVAILLDWMRIFAPLGTRGAFFWTCQGLLWFSVLFYFAVEVASNLACIPFHRMWDKRIPGTCFDRTSLDLVTGSVNLFTDVFILLFPQRIIWRLQLSIKKKIGVSFLFAVGVAACVSAAFRVAATVEYSKSLDWSYAISKVALWCLAELTCLYLVFCIPTIPRAFNESNLLKKIINSLKSRGESIRPRSYSKSPSSSNAHYQTMGSDVRLQNIGPLQSQQAYSNSTEMPLDSLEEIPKVANDHGHIMCTTEFIAIEERGNNENTGMDVHRSWDPTHLG